MKFVTQPDLETLPQRAIDLYAAREVLRALQWHRKANRGAPQAELFEQLAAELQAPTVNAATLRRLQSQFETLYEPLPGGFPRFAAVSAASVCEDEPRDRGTACSLSISLRTSCWWLPKDHIIDDYKLWQRTHLTDFRVLAAMSPAQLQSASARDIGPLWRERTPHWLETRFPTRAANSAGATIESGDVTAPPGASAALEPAIPAPNSLPRCAHSSTPAPSTFDTRSTRSTCNSLRTTRTQSRPASSAPPKSAAPSTSPAATTSAPPPTPAPSPLCNPPAPPPTCARSSTSTAPHDGALLFLPDGVETGWAHAELIGLRDQPRAKRILLYDLESLDDPERVPRMLSKARLTPKTIHILAFIRRATLVVDLGPRAPGRILTMDVNGVFRPFAPDFTAALARIIRDIARIGGRHGLVEGPDDETGRSGILRLRSAQKRRAADTE